MGASVVALCEDDNHVQHLNIALKQRAVEAMLMGSRVFKGTDLQARAIDLVPMMGKTNKAQNKESRNEKEDEGGQAQE